VREVANPILLGMVPVRNSPPSNTSVTFPPPSQSTPAHKQTDVKGVALSEAHVHPDCPFVFGAVEAANAHSAIPNVARVFR